RSQPRLRRAERRICRHGQGRHYRSDKGGAAGFAERRLGGGPVGHDRGDGRRKAQKGDQPGNAAWRRNGRDGRLLIIKRTTTRPTSHEGCRPFLQTGQIVFKTLGGRRVKSACCCRCGARSHGSLSRIHNVVSSQPERRIGETRRSPNRGSLERIRSKKGRASSFLDNNVLSFKRLHL